MCRGPKGVVQMANSALDKKIEDIEVGDVIRTRDNRTDIVEYVVKTYGNHNIAAVKILESNLVITPFHPIRQGYTNKFVLPKDEPHEKINIDVVYNFVLRNRSHLYVNHVEAPTLGDGDRSDPVLAHEYWGTKRIISDIEKISQFTKSNVIYLDAVNNSIMIDNDGNDIGIVHTALEYP